MPTPDEPRAFTDTIPQKHPSKPKPESHQYSNLEVIQFDNNDKYRVLPDTTDLEPVSQPFMHVSELEVINNNGNPPPSSNKQNIIELDANITNKGSKRISGLSTRGFWILVIIMTVILAIGIGGGVAGGLMRSSREVTATTIIVIQTPAVTVTSTAGRKSTVPTGTNLITSTSSTSPAKIPTETLPKPWYHQQAPVSGYRN
ncbi:hypothetical protein QBC38DRAFT_450918 [Podospora fimiseda]|uniref:Uncharacterized protein n=1 Tax=Podospora fimiseda TaxID=252190 RepID=A0AAN7BY03_9PEZI|nr:hypothetical protein QBC38DRAFT_450918 [Podospora fimiseda]